MPLVYGFNSNPGNEDCLYLNVYAPPRAENLPVLVWIRKHKRIIIEPQIELNEADIEQPTKMAAVTPSSPPPTTPAP